VPDNVSSVTLEPSGSQMVASAIISSNSGIGAFPLVLGSELTRAAVPNADIAVINR
jgi:hypothetical protein